MSNRAVSCIQSGVENFSNSLIDVKERTYERAAAVKTFFSAKGTHLKDAIQHRIQTDQGIIRFIKTNWKQLISYTVAWAIIITGLGLLYGFRMNALPLTIGYGAGMGIGMVGGIIVAVADRNNRFDGKNTLWGLINRGFNGLDANGTRPIIVSVSITVMMAVAPIFPHVLGGIFGAIVGNHLMTKICYNIKKSLNPDAPIEGHLDLGTTGKNPALMSKKLQSAEQKLKAAKEKLTQLTAQMEEAQKIIAELKAPENNE